MSVVKIFTFGFGRSGTGKGVGRKPLLPLQCGFGHCKPASIVAFRPFRPFRQQPPDRQVA